MGRDSGLTADEPFEPDMDDEDAAEVLAQTSGRGGSSVDKRMEGYASANDKARAEKIQASSGSYADRLLQLAEKWDSGQAPSEAEIEYVAGRAAVGILLDVTEKTTHRQKAIDQVLRIREKHLLVVTPVAGQPPQKPPAVTLPGSQPRLVTGS